MTSLVIGIVASVISVILGLWTLISKIHKKRETREHILMHLDAGDRFAALDEYVQAIAEYQKVIDLDKTHIEAHRRIISAKREIVQRKVFLESDSFSISLYKGYCDSGTPAGEDINEALTMLYQLQAINPDLKNDVNLLLDEAGILKAGGRSARHGIKILARVLELEPENALALAEKGILHASIGEDISEVQEGLALIRRAIDLEPKEARYHYYLASALEYTNKCNRSKSDDLAGPDGCAEAIRQYHLATEMATGDDVWSKQIKYRAPNKALEIFRSYVTSSSTILSTNLEMSLEERATEIEFLLENKARISGGIIAEIRPLYWLATLYHALGDNEKAEQRMRRLVEEEGDLQLPTVWVTLFLSILEANGCHDETYRWLKESIKDKKLEATESLKTESATRARRMR